MLGSQIKFQITDGNVYGDKLATVLASARDVPDWVCVPDVEPARRGSAPRSSRTSSRTSRRTSAGDKVTAVPEPGQHPLGRVEVLRLQRQALRPAVPRRGHHRRDLLPPGRPRRAGHHAGRQERPGPPRPRGRAHRRQPSGAPRTCGTRPRSSTRCPPKWKLDGDTLVHRVETERVPRGPRVERRAVRQRRRAPRRRRRPVRRGQGAVPVRQVADHERRRRRLARGAARQPGQQPRRTGSSRSHPFDGRRRHPGALEGQPGEHLLVHQEDGRRGQDQGAARDRQRARGAVRHHGVRHHQQRRRGRALHARRRRPAGAHRAGRHRAAADVHLPGRPAAVARPRCSTPATSRRPRSGRRTRRSTRPSPLFYAQQIVEPQQYASIGQPFVDLEKDISRGRKSMDDLDAAVETWKSSGGEELRAFYQDILDQQSFDRADCPARSPAAPPRPGRRRRRRPSPTRKIGWRVRLRRDRSLLLMVTPAILLLGGVRVRPDAGQRHRVAAVLAVHGVPGQPVRRLGQLRARVHQPAVPQRGREHARHHGVPAGVLLPDPDHPGAAAQQRRHAADPHDDPVDRLPARTSSRGCWW